MPFKSKEAKAKWRRENRAKCKQHRLAYELRRDPDYLKKRGRRKARKTLRKKAKEKAKQKAEEPRRCDCGQFFTPRVAHQRYCQPACRPSEKRWVREPRSCPVCKEAFDPKAPNQIVCGDEECRKEWVNARDRKHYAESPELRAKKIAASCERYATDPGYRQQENARSRERNLKEAERQATMKWAALAAELEERN